MTQKPIPNTELYSVDPEDIVIHDAILTIIKRKYEITLRLINNICMNIGIDQIDDLTKFKDIDRQLIIDSCNDEILEDMLPEIYKNFGKRECQFSQKSKTKHYILTILKNMCRQLALTLTKRYKNIQRKGVVKSYIFYSIDYSAEKSKASV